MKIEGGSGGVVDGTDGVVTVLQNSSDFEGSAAAVGKLGDGIGGSGALDLDRSDDNVADLESAERAACVGTVGGIEATVFS